MNSNSAHSVEEERDASFSGKETEPQKNSDIFTRSKSALRKRGAPKNIWGKAPNKKKSFSSKSLLNQSGLSWTLLEKRCLLEGLKNYGPRNTKLIANLIGSKSEPEVQEKIFSLRGSAACDIQGSDSIKQEDKAPIEKWIHSVTELVNCDDTDYSQMITKALGYIAKHEDFEDSQVADLSWKNIYMFLYELAENREFGLPKLSDIESMILLELMSDLGLVLKKSNTSCQRQILEHKIQMIDAGLGIANADRPQRAQCTSLLARALANDFTGLDGLLVNSKQKSSDSSIHKPHKDNRSGIEAESTSSWANSDKLFSNNDACSSSSTPVESHIGTASSSVHQMQTEAENNLVPRHEVDLSQHVVLRNAVGVKKTFIKPKFFTLNPLCIPTKLLDFPSNV
ncbi:hypothetical protein PoB_005399800 [Plakobranchus ocellatus]|uniref:Uncharacterized protein n=1 Tax=Plakobranchus ocellatus TaxID=259542 RepID=A0AAV4C909_9GAST|nr:hypothetical protein PoB_005399800 [Plakobranchus ocellatus]